MKTVGETIQTVIAANEIQEGVRAAHIANSNNTELIMLSPDRNPHVKAAYDALHALFNHIEASANGLYGNVHVEEARESKDLYASALGELGLTTWAAIGTEAATQVAHDRIADMLDTVDDGRKQVLAGLDMVLGRIVDKRRLVQSNVLGAIEEANGTLQKAEGDIAKLRGNGS